MTGLLVENITAGYEKRDVVSNVSFEAGRGELCALLGRNGSGKSTLIKAVGGLIPARTGRCLVDGLDCTRFHERRRACYISYIPQRYSKLLGVAVRDVLLMGYNPHLPLLGSPTRAEIGRVEGALAEMGLDAQVDFAHLSEGQKQLVMLARTLIQDSPVMLMDEPDSSLDFTNRHAALRKTRELIRRGGKTGLIALHDPNFALDYCDKIVLIEDGRVAGQLRPRAAVKSEVRRTLSRIYDDIDVLEYGGRFIVQTDVRDDDAD